MSGPDHIAAPITMAASYAALALLHGGLAHTLYPIRWEYERWGKVALVGTLCYGLAMALAHGALVVNMLVKVLVVGCGRVGSAVSLQLRAAGWDVSVIDENEDALGRLGDDWTGEFHVGHGMDIQLLRTAGIEDADAVVVTTDGDNSNIVIGQMAQKNFGVRSVIVRILDPARADFFKTRGLDVVCPTQSAIETLTTAVRAVEGALA